eukprot:636651-Pelagomonas_calceolata.AAC.7
MTDCFIGMENSPRKGYILHMLPVQIAQKLGLSLAVKCSPLAFCFSKHYSACPRLGPNANSATV